MNPYNDKPEAPGGSPVPYLLGGGLLSVLAYKGFSSLNFKKMGTSGAKTVSEFIQNKSEALGQEAIHAGRRTAFPYINPEPPRAIGGSSISGFRAEPRKVEDLVNPGSWSSFATENRQFQLYQLRNSPIGNFPDVLHDNNVEVIMGSDALNQQVHSAHENHFQGIKARYQEIVRAETGRTLREHRAAAHVGQAFFPGMKKGLPEFVAREQAAIARISNVTEKLQSAYSGMNIQLVGLKRGGSMPPEVAMVIGASRAELAKPGMTMADLRAIKKAHVVTLGSALGTELGFGGSIYRGSSFILHHGKGREIEAGTFRETQATLLERLEDIIKSPDRPTTAKGLAKRIRTLVDPLRQQVMHAETAAGKATIQRRRGAMMTRHETSRIHSVQALPEVLQDVGFKPGDPTDKFTNKLLELSNNRFTQHAKELIYGTKGHITASHLIRQFGMGIKSEHILGLHFGLGSMMRNAISYTGAPGFSENLYKDYKEYAVTGKWFEPMEGSEKIRSKFGYGYNKSFGLGKTDPLLRRMEMASGMPGAADKGLLNIMGDTLFINELYKMEGGKAVAISPSEAGLGLAAPSGQGLMWMDKDLATVEHAKDMQLVLRGDPEKIKSFVKEHEKPGYYKMSAKTAEQRGFKVYSAKGNSFRPFSGEGYFDFGQVSYGQDHALIAGRVHTPMGMRNSALRVGGLHLMSTHTMEQIGEGPNRYLAGAVLRTNVKDPEVVRGIQGIIMRAADESRVDMEKGHLRDFVSNLIGETFQGKTELKDAGSINTAFRDVIQKVQKKVTDTLGDSNKVSKLGEILARDLRYGEHRIKVHGPGGGEYMAKGISGLLSYGPRTMGLSEMSKIHTDVDPVRARYLRAQSVFNAKMERLAQHAEDNNTRGLANQFLESEKSMLGLLEEHSMESGPRAGELIRSIREQAMKSQDIIHQLGQQSPTAHGHKLKGAAYKYQRWTRGIESEYGKLQSLAGELEQTFADNASARPSVLSSRDLEMIGIKGYETGDDSLYQYLMAMQRGSKAKRSYQSTLEAMMPFLNMSADSFVKDVGEKYKDKYFGGRVFDLEKNVEDMKIITGTMDDIYLKYREARRSGQEFTKADLTSYLNRSDLRKTFMERFHERPEDLFEKSLALTGLPDQTLMNIAVTNAKRDFQTGAIVEKIMTASAKTKSVILPGVAAAGAMWSEGLNPFMRANNLRNSIFEIHGGLSKLLQKASDTGDIREAYGRFIQFWAEQHHRTGLAGQAGSLIWQKSAYANIVDLPANILKDIKTARSESFAAEQAATVLVSREMAEKWRMKGDTAKFGLFRADPVLAPGQLRLVKFRVNEALEGAQIQVSYGLSYAGHRDMDADHVSLFYMGDKQEMAGMLRRTGYNPTDANKLAEGWIRNIQSSWRKDSESILRMHQQQLQMSDALISRSQGAYLNLELANEGERWAVSKIIKQLDINQGVSDDYIRSLTKAMGVSTEAAQKVLMTKLKSASLGFMTNKIDFIRATLNDFAVGINKTKVERRFIDLAGHFLQQPSQALISVKKHSMIGTASGDIALLLSGIDPTDPHLGKIGHFLTETDEAAIRARIREALTPEEAAITLTGSNKSILVKWNQLTDNAYLRKALGEPDLSDQILADMKRKAASAFKDKASYEHWQYTQLLDFQNFKVQDDAVNQMAKIFVETGNMLRRKDDPLTHANYILTRMLRRKKGLGSGKIGQFDVEELLQESEAMISRLAREGEGDLAYAGTARMLLEHLGHPDLAPYYSKEKIASLVDKVEQLEGRAASEHLNSASETVSKSGVQSGWWGTTTAKMEKALTESPRAKWLAVGGAVAATVAMTAGMFSSPVYAPSGTGTTTPPVRPAPKMTPTIRGSQFPGKTYMEPTYDLSNRFVVHGSATSPEVAAMRMKMNVAGDGNFSIMDSSMNSAQFNQAYETMAGGRF